MAAGDMPISASIAVSQASNPNVYAGTTFNFYSPGATSGANTMSPTSNTNATAESSAASGGAKAATSGVGTGIGGTASMAATPAGGNNLILIGAALLALWIWKH